MALKCRTAAEVFSVEHPASPHKELLFKFKHNYLVKTIPLWFLCIMSQIQ